MSRGPVVLLALHLGVEIVNNRERMLFNPAKFLHHSFDVVTHKLRIDGNEGFDNLSLKPYRDLETDRKSTRLNSSHLKLSRMPSSA